MDRSGAPERVPSRLSKKGRIPYGLRLAVAVVILGGFTTAFVLLVLPQRYVFQTGLQSSGVSFPTADAPFPSTDLVMVQPRPAPPPPPPPEEEPPVEPEPTPAELLWERTRPLMAAGRADEALPHFREYLVQHPGDMTVQMEYAVALVRVGEWEEADAVFRSVAEATGGRRARLERARLLRDREDWAPALALYRDLAAERPGDLEIREELARTLATAAHYGEAAEAYGELLADDPDRHGARLALARVLWSADDPEAARRVVAQVPPGVPERSEAEELQALLTAALEPVVEKPPEQEAPDRLARARQEAEEGRETVVQALYREDREDEPADPVRLLEWADLHQYFLEDFDGTLEILEERGGLEPPTSDLRLRMARLYSWTGREEAARDELLVLLDTDEDRAEGWALLGDLRRWSDARPQAADAYRRALSLDPEEPQALAGREALREATERVIAGRENPGLGPTLSFFRDSEGFRWLDVSARGSLLQDRRDALSVRSGYRRLEGLRPDGLEGVEDGFFAEADLSRWWREGTVRGAVTLGVEQFSGAGVEPVFGARLEAGQLDGWSLDVSYRHGRGYPLLTTLESVDPIIRADRLAIAVDRALTGEWAASGAAEAGSFRGGGSDVWRLGAGGSLSRRVVPDLRVGISSRILSFSDPAPRLQDRRAFWDPELFWSTEIPLELGPVSVGAWSPHARVAPGLALVRDREEPGSRWIPQMGGELGTRYAGDRVVLDMNLFAARGREGDYNAFGVNLGLTLRR